MEILHVVTALSLFVLGIGQNVTLPPCPDPPYNNAFAEVIVDELYRLREYMVTGAPNVGIPILDPYGPIPHLSVNVSNDFIELQDTINETVIYNLSLVEVCKFFVYYGIREDFDMELRLDVLTGVGLYELNGVLEEEYGFYQNGNYTMEVYNASLPGNGTLTYLPLEDILQITELELELRFEDFELFLDCVVGCGSLENISSVLIREVAVLLFDTVWEYYDPLLTDAIQRGLNSVLEDIKISEIFTSTTTEIFENDEEELEQGQNFELPLSKILNEGLKRNRPMRN